MIRCVRYPIPRKNEGYAGIALGQTGQVLERNLVVHAKHRHTALLDRLEETIAAPRIEGPVVLAWPDGHRAGPRLKGGLELRFFTGQVIACGRHNNRTRHKRGMPPMRLIELFVRAGDIVDEGIGDFAHQGPGDIETRHLRDQLLRGGDHGIARFGAAESGLCVKQLDVHPLPRVFRTVIALRKSIVAVPGPEINGQRLRSSGNAERFSFGVARDCVSQR